MSMQYQISIQEAIFTLSNFNKQIDRMNRLFYSNFFGPVAVNGVALSFDDKANANQADLQTYQNLIADVSELRQKITEANHSIEIDGKAVSYQLERLRLNRHLIEQLDSLIERHDTRVENGVGVVEYKAYSEDYIRETVDLLRKEMNQLSTKIDHSNAVSMITVELLTEI